MQRTLTTAITAVTATVTGAVVLLGTGIAFADDGGRGMRPFDGDRRHHPWFMLVCLLVVLAVGGLVWWLIARSRRRNAALAPVRHAETILAERLARGEITADEYRASLQVLRSDRAEPVSAE